MISVELKARGVPLRWITSGEYECTCSGLPAGVGFETRQALLGHFNGNVTTHYSGAELSKLIGAVDRINTTRSTPVITMLRAVA